jgi:hypothetical protein
MPPMRGGFLLTIALSAAAPMAAPSLTLDLRIFNGIEEITSQTRVSVYRAGDRTEAVATSDGRTSPTELKVPPGIYDVQAIHQREQRVVKIRWAERLVVMPYPDEKGHHLEVINFQSDYGALEVRTHNGGTPQVAIYAAGDRRKPAAAPIAGKDAVLFVVPAGAYDVQSLGGRGAWHPGLEVPQDRTRLLIIP